MARFRENFVLSLNATSTILTLSFISHLFVCCFNIIFAKVIHIARKMRCHSHFESNLAAHLWVLFGLPGNIFAQPMRQVNEQTFIRSFVVYCTLYNVYLSVCSRLSTLERYTKLLFSSLFDKFCRSINFGTKLCEIQCMLQCALHYRGKH